jgi:hypothetical protein
MPVPQLKKLAKKTKTNLKTVEKDWSKAKEEYPGNWKAIAGTTKKIEENRMKARKKK